MNNEIQRIRIHLGTLFILAKKNEVESKFSTVASVVACTYVVHSSKLIELQMASRLKFLIIHRPGVYHTHSQVIAPMEHALVNDGFPLLQKQFKERASYWIRTHFNQFKSVEFHDISLQEANQYLGNIQYSPIDDDDGVTIMLNHPKQYKMAAWNLQQLYVAVSESDWRITPETFDYFGGSQYISTCLAHTGHVKDSKWRECSHQELMDIATISLRRTFRRYQQ